MNRFLMTGMLSMLLISCAGRNTAPLPAENTLVVFPPPPDTARIQYLTSISSSIDVVGELSFLQRYVLGDEPDKPINKPYGITAGRDKLYLCDTMLPGLEIIDLKNRRFDYFTPSGLGQLKKPINCALDPEDRLYVADAERRQVVIFAANGTYLNVIGDGVTGKPTDVQIFDNKIWICDLDAHLIRVYELETRREINSFPAAKANSPQYLFSPTNLTIKDERVYVTDTGDARVKCYSLQGEYLGAVGGYGRRPGNFARPKGIDVDLNGNLYVVDAGFENAQIFNKDLKLLMFFGGKSGQPGSMWLPAGIEIDEQNLAHFQQYVYHDFNLEYLIFTTNQYGPAKINVYGFIKKKV